MRPPKYCNPMKKVILTAILSVATMASAYAGEIVTDSIYSNILRSEVKYNVYLPDGFKDSSKCYPVVYLLHGLSDDYRCWAQKGRVDWVANELIESGEVREMVIVMPNAGGQDTHNIPNGYFNVAGWNYEDFFFQEFIPTVESKYRCISDKGHRAIMGLSMGGGGSTAYAQMHPDMFSSCYSMSGWLDDDTIARKGDSMPIDRYYYTCKSVHEHSALDFVDSADEATLERLRTVKWFIDCGDDDFLLQVSVGLHFKMRKAGVKSELRVRDGVHNWEYWHNALRLALPFASRNFDR